MSFWSGGRTFWKQRVGGGGGAEEEGSTGSCSTFMDVHGGISFNYGLFKLTGSVVRITLRIPVCQH